MMKRVLFLSVVMLIWGSLISYTQDTGINSELFANSAENLLLKDTRFVVGGYGEVHYNHALDANVINAGELDVHRIVMLFGYNFNERTQFITELEFEHVSEVYVEQAFLQYKLSSFLNFRAGLMLVPMGIINEYHEPVSFNGVERPLVDKYMVPTTWREIGLGITGNILPVSMKYQAYLINGFNGYDGTARLNGKNGLRSGRQKGAESYMNSPNFTAKIEYYGIRGLNIGMSGYFGKTQSTLYDGLDKNDDLALAMADSSVIAVSMLGLDARYSLKGLRLRGQFYYSGLSNSEQYNAFTADSDGTLNDLGNAMLAWYAEAGYNVLKSVNTEMQLHPFIRYEFLNTHHAVDDNISRNLKYEKSLITTGISLNLTSGAILKADIQFVKDATGNKFSRTFNAGYGVMF